MKKDQEHGGKRPGAGRPPGALNKRTVASNEAASTLPHCDDPLAFLRAVMTNAGIDARLRIDAAKAMLPFAHMKKGEGGIKDEKQAAAKKASTGRFRAALPPLRSVK